MRNKSFECISTVSQSYKKMEQIPVKSSKKKNSTSISVPIFGVEDFYGVSTEKVKYLLPEVMGKFVLSILDSKQEILADETFIQRKISDILVSGDFDNSSS